MGCVELVKDGLVHSEGLSVCPGVVGWDVAGFSKVGMACPNKIECFFLLTFFTSSHCTVFSHSVVLLH